MLDSFIEISWDAGKLPSRSGSPVQTPEKGLLGTACFLFLPSGYQPLTAPMVMPLVKYFWNTRNTMIMGTEAMAAPAMSRP